MMSEKNYSRQIFLILLIFSVVLLGVLGKVLSSVIIPVVVSVLMSLVLYPIIKKLYLKFHLPWALGTVLMVVSVLIVIALLGTFVGNSVSAFLSQYSKYETKLLSLYKLLADTFNFQFDADKNFFENLWAQLRVREFLQSFAFSVSGNLISFTKTFGLILLFTFFLLLELKFGGEKVDAMFKFSLKERVRGIFKKIISDTARFLSIKFLISLATGFSIFLMCLVIGLDFAPMWAFLAFILNFIPTFGSIFSVLIMTVFATLQFYPNPARIVLIFIFTTLINFILGNIIEPKIEGKNLGVSPFVILVSLTFWGWMWGFVGMILAVPVMVIIKICFENIEILQPFAILIGNRPFETMKEFYSEKNEKDESDDEQSAASINNENPDR